jgi:hypothetical protein
LLKHVVFVLHLLLTSFLFAQLEIQVEGPHGWAARLPTWKIENRWTRLFFSSKPLTGYHFFLIPYALGLGPIMSLALELRILSFFILFWIVEDFLWFVMNAAFGVRRFKREHIWWHSAHWWWIMPRDYWLFLPVGIGLYVVSWLI